MEIDKVITYSAIGVAGIVCLVFLLDLTAGIFGSGTSRWTFCLSWERRFSCGRESRRFWNSAELRTSSLTRAANPRHAVNREGTADVADVDCSRRSAAILRHQSVDQSVPCEFGRFDRDVPTQALGRRRSDRAQARQTDLTSDPPACRFRQTVRAAAR